MLVSPVFILPYLHLNLHHMLKADTQEGFCSRSMLPDHFACVSTHEGAFSTSLYLPESLLLNI